MVEIGNGCRQGGAIDLHQVGASGQQFVVGHPHQVSSELVGDLRTVAHGCQHVAARDIDLVGKRDGDGISDSARSSSPPGPMIVLIVALRPEGRAAISSPGLALPQTMVPEKPRKSRFGRLTHCTGMRNGRAERLSPTSMVSRCSSR